MARAQRASGVELDSRWFFLRGAARSTIRGKKILDQGLRVGLLLADVAQAGCNAGRRLSLDAPKEDAVVVPSPKRR
jgi:hypothetical protein